MPKVITYGGDTEIGAYKFPDRKKVCLCIKKGNVITVYGTFNSEYCENNIMDELGKFLCAEPRKAVSRNERNMETNKRV